MVHRAIEKMFNVVTLQKSKKTMKMGAWNKAEQESMEKELQACKADIALLDKKIASLVHKIGQAGKTPQVPEIVAVIEFTDSDVLKPVEDKVNGDEKKLWTVRNLEHMQLEREMHNAAMAHESRVLAVESLEKQLKA